MNQRLNEVYRRAQAGHRPGTAQESFIWFCEILDRVEDEMSGVAKQCPPPADGGGRMYCPLDDHINYTNRGIEAVTTGHRIRVAADGAITITSRRTGAVEFTI